MAGVEVGGVMAKMSGGRLGSRRQGADIALTGKTVAEHDLDDVPAAAAAAKASLGGDPARASDAFRLDAIRDVRDPRAWSAMNSASIFIWRPAIRRPRAT